jgi:hypothetical protein
MQPHAAAGPGAGRSSGADVRPGAFATSGLPQLRTSANATGMSQLGQEPTFPMLALFDPHDAHQTPSPSILAVLTLTRRSSAALHCDSFGALGVKPSLKSHYPEPIPVLDTAFVCSEQFCLLFSAKVKFSDVHKPWMD